MFCNDKCKDNIFLHTFLFLLTVSVWPFSNSCCFIKGLLPFLLLLHNEQQSCIHIRYISVKSYHNVFHFVPYFMIVCNALQESELLYDTTDIKTGAGSWCGQHMCLPYVAKFQSPLKADGKAIPIFFVN